MAELIAAVEQEYRKLGRLVLEREFGRVPGAAPLTAPTRCPIGAFASER